MAPQKIHLSKTFQYNQYYTSLLHKQSDCGAIAADHCVDKDLQLQGMRKL